MPFNGREKKCQTNNQSFDDYLQARALTALLNRNDAVGIQRKGAKAQRYAYHC